MTAFNLLRYFLDISSPLQVQHLHFLTTFPLEKTLVAFFRTPSHFALWSQVATLPSYCKAVCERNKMYHVHRHPPLEVCFHKVDTHKISGAEISTCRIQYLVWLCREIGDWFSTVKWQGKPISGPIMLTNSDRPMTEWSVSIYIFGVQTRVLRG